MRFTGSLDGCGINAWRWLQVSAGLGLTLLLALAGVSLMLPPAMEMDELGESSEAGEARQSAVAQWQALWADIAERGEAALQPAAAADSSLRSAGDTAFMRYRNQWGAVDDQARRTFQLAALANDPGQKLALLESLRGVDPPLIRARALLEIARVQLRRRAFSEALTAAQAAQAIPDLPDRVLADADFIMGYAALEQQDLDRAEVALARAVDRDSGFWDARQTQLLVLARQLDQPRQNVAACLNRSRRMIENLGALPALAQDRKQLRDIADRFAISTDGAANPAFFLLSGLGYQWAGDRERAQAALTKASQTSGRLPRQCAALIAERAMALLQPDF